MRLTIQTKKRGFEAKGLFPFLASWYDNDTEKAMEGVLLFMEATLDFIVTNLPLILCLLTGVALLVLEVFVPGFGLPGISGLILLTAGIVMTWMNYGMVAGLAVTLISLALAGISISVSIKSAASGKLSKSALILNEVTQSMENDEIKAFLGREGVTTTVLNPVGIAEFDGVRLNVLSEDSFLERGVRVRVSKVEGTRIIVREIKG